jgi:hypothetical protein
MRPKIHSSKIRSNLEKTKYPKQGKIKRCQLCEYDPKQIIYALRLGTRTRRIYFGLYTVSKSGEFQDGNILQVCRNCFLLGKENEFLRSARPPGAQRKSRHKWP